MQNQYSFQDHLHNYAVWTAARAVQRGFKGAKTGNIKKAIEQSSLVTFNKDSNCGSLEDFKIFHMECAKEIMYVLKEMGLNEATYGRAAKIIAIYLKTAIVIPFSGQGELCNLIHPPIDKILLDNICRKNKIKKLCAKGWTSFTEKDYWDLCERLLQEGFKLNWTLEEYWHPEQELLTVE